MSYIQHWYWWNHGLPTTRLSTPRFLDPRREWSWKKKPSFRVFFHDQHCDAYLLEAVANSESLNQVWTAERIFHIPADLSSTLKSDLSYPFTLALVSSTASWSKTSYSEVSNFLDNHNDLVQNITFLTSEGSFKLFTGIFPSRDCLPNSLPQDRNIGSSDSSKQAWAAERKFLKMLIVITL